MIKSLRPLLLAGLLLPLALPVSAATINTALTPNVEKALKASKLQPTALSLVMVPLDGPLRENIGLLGSPAFEIPRSVLRDRPDPRRPARQYVGAGMGQYL
mgnify:CR=1 FL=1